MSITVERRYRVTTPNGTESDMSEDEARALALGLLAALGLAPAAMADAEPVPAMIAPPAQLPSGQVPTREPKATKGGLKTGDWDADVPELRRMLAADMSLAEMARRLNRPLAGVSTKIWRMRREDALRETPPEPPAPAIVAPLPVVSATEAAAVHGAVGWQPDSGWTREQTTALIRAMAPGHGGIREASEATGHSMGGCGLRWKHLKSAGIMTVEKYQSGPEAVPA